MVMDVTAFFAQMGFLNFVFSFLLVFALLYALFSKTKVPSDKPDLNALIAFVLAFLVSISPGFSGFLLAYVPYAATIFVLIALGFVIFSFFGAKPEQAIKVSSLVYGVLILLIIGAFAILGTVWTTTPSPSGTNNSVSTAVANTSNSTIGYCSSYNNLVGFQAVQCMLGDPLFLGVIVVMAIIGAAVYLLVVPPKK